MTLRVSIVTYAPDFNVLEATLVSLKNALVGIRNDYSLVIVDNGPPGFEDGLRHILSRLDIPAEFVGGHGNIGYGRGHNLAIDVSSEFHLILNPDVELAEDALTQAIEFMRLHPECGLVTPSACDEAGDRLYLCKRYPTVADLALRGFAPACLKAMFGARLADYELRDQIGDKIYWGPPVVSGCFMFFRSSVFRDLEGFDRRYFLYFEDFDISLRAARITRIAYVPDVRIIHRGGQAARKGWSHIKMFCVSAVTFFQDHGWKWVWR